MLSQSCCHRTLFVNITNTCAASNGSLQSWGSVEMLTICNHELTGIFWGPALIRRLNHTQKRRSGFLINLILFPHPFWFMGLISKLMNMGLTCQKNYEINFTYFNCFYIIFWLFVRKSVDRNNHYFSSQFFKTYYHRQLYNYKSPLL